MLKKLLFVFLLLFLLLIVLIIDNYININVTNYTIETSKIDDNMNGYKIMLLSDLHNRNITNKLVSIIKQEKPNIIIMAGDMIDYEKDNNFFDLISKIDDNTIYYVYGNHEHYIPDDSLEKIEEKLKNTNVKLINNKKIQITDNFNIYGFDYDADYYFYEEYINKLDDLFKSELGNVEKDKFNLLVSHNPLNYELYSKLGFDLTLSGHIHGGIIYIPFFGGVLSPDGSFFPKYFKGINKIGNMDLIVSKGLGYGYNPPVRVLNRPEIVIINFSKN